MKTPDVHYARSGDVSIAYQVVGEGPPDLLLLPFLSSLWWLWQYPHFAPFVERLARSRRVTIVNTRGMGLSDRPRVTTIESRMDDVLAVLDELRIERFSLLGIGETAATCIVFAATTPIASSASSRTSLSCAGSRPRNTRGGRRVKSGSRSSALGANAGARGSTSRSSRAS
jgi:pimeloyl-ACP methyl ester carboxylesterase